MTERSGEFGTIDLPALQRIRTLWVDEEPLVADTGYDDPVEPTELRIELTDGLGDAAAARLDVQWTELGNYSFHYVDSEDVNWRFNSHPSTHSPERHFHPPPSARTADAEPSCIRVAEVSLVTRAVHKLWRTAYESGDLGLLDSVSNPP